MVKQEYPRSRVVYHSEWKGSSGAVSCTWRDRGMQSDARLEGRTLALTHSIRPRLAHQEDNRAERPFVAHVAAADESIPDSMRWCKQCRATFHQVQHHHSWQFHGYLHRRYDIDVHSYIFISCGLRYTSTQAESLALPLHVHRSRQQCCRIGAACKKESHSQLKLYGNDLEASEGYLDRCFIILL